MRKAIELSICGSLGVTSTILFTMLLFLDRVGLAFFVLAVGLFILYYTDMRIFKTKYICIILMISFSIIFLLEYLFTGSPYTSLIQ